MTVSSTGVKPLLLAGGKSAKMKFPKHLLEMPDGRPLYQHQIDLLSRACPEAPSIYISLAEDSETDPFLQDVAKPDLLTQEAPPVAIIYDSESSGDAQSSGPAAGLLAAFKAHPQVTWLVIACDYPLLDVETLRQLRSAYKPPVACFRNQDGFCEPLLGIWSPEALSRLAENAKKGISGPMLTIKDVNGTCLDPPENAKELFLNVNTESDWRRALDLIQQL